MKKLALVIAAAAVMFAAAPASAQGMHRDGMHRDGVRHGSAHRGHKVTRPHVRRAPRIVVMPRRHHQRRGHVTH